MVPSSHEHRIRDAARRRFHIRRWVNSLYDPERLTKPGRAAIFTGAAQRRVFKQPGSQNTPTPGQPRPLSPPHPPPTPSIAHPPGTYIGVVGLCLLLAPLSTFALLFDPSAVSAAWIRVGGVLCAVFGAPGVCGGGHGNAS